MDTCEGRGGRGEGLLGYQSEVSIVSGPVVAGEERESRLQNKKQWQKKFCVKMSVERTIICGLEVYDL